MRRLQLLYPKYYRKIIIFKKYMPRFLVNLLRIHQTFLIRNAPMKPSINVTTQKIISDNVH